MPTKRSTAKKERDSQAAFMCGQAFQKLAEGFIRRIGTIKEQSSQAMSNELGDLVACATNLGFALELYLKALLTQLDLPVPQTHDLRALYDSLPQPVRALIEGVYDISWPDQLRGRRASITLARGPRDEPLWDDYTKLSRALPDLLARSKDLFQSWRYVFEFSQPEDNLYQFHKFEYGLLRCAAEAMSEIMIRLSGTAEAPSPNVPAGEP